MSELVTTMGRTGSIVAVIASAADLRRAVRLRHAPDLFELRLDALCEIIDQVFSTVPKLRAPLIITARHPVEGGLNQLGATKRRDVLLKFLSVAAFVDVELRSIAPLQSVLDAAHDLQVRRILSVHDLRGTPGLSRLERLAATARQNRADIFKVATRADDNHQAMRLLDFFRVTKQLMPVSAMSIGQNARELRLVLAREGSALNYTHLGIAHADGQWLFSDMRRALQFAR